MSGTEQREVDIARVNRAALAVLPALLALWLPEGRQEGEKWLARNPRSPGYGRLSLRVNMRTGRWVDDRGFATGESAVELLSYVAGISRETAARKMLGMVEIKS